MCAWGVPAKGPPVADSVVQPAGVFPGVDMGGEGLEAPSLPVPLPSGRLPVDSTKTSPTGGDGAPSGEVSSRIMPSPCAPLALLQMREPLRRQSSQQ
jgi:hypothetical protein